MSLSDALLQKTFCVHYVFKSEGEGRREREKETQSTCRVQRTAVGVSSVLPSFRFQGWNWGHQTLYLLSHLALSRDASIPFLHALFCSFQFYDFLLCFFYYSNCCQYRSPALPCPATSTYISFYSSLLLSGIANKFHIHVVNNIYTTSFRYMC